MLKGFLFMTKKNGLPCKKCGTSEWDNRGRCRECQRVRNRQWSTANPDKAAECQRRCYENNRLKVLERSSQWQRNNPDRVADRDRRYKQNNPDRVAEKNRRWYQANLDRVKKNGRIWRQRNPDKLKAKSHRRRTDKTQAGGAYTVAEWKSLCRHYSNKCLKCGRDDVKLTADHIKPVSRGGTSNIDNIQPLCGSCNSAKKDKHIDYRPDAGPVRWIQCKIFG